VRLRGEPPFVLTLDVGTSSTRALLFDARGRRVSEVHAHAKHDLATTPDGGAFFDPEDLCRLASGCLDQARQTIGDAPLAALAMDSFWHSLMGVDARGQPSTRLLTWADTRAAQAAHELAHNLDEDQVHARTGCRLHASYWPAKLRWLETAEPEAFRRTKRWLSFAEYFQWRVTGQLACSLSMASATGLLNQRASKWDGKLLAALHIEPEQLSPLVDPGEPLPGGWLPAVGDGVASNAGSGCLTPDRIAVNVGTSSAMRLLIGQGRQPASPAVVGQEQTAFALWRYRVDRRRILIGGALSEGGNLWAWLRSSLRLPSVAASEAELAAMEPDTHGLTVLPFIAGERSPGWASGARLTVTGGDLNTRPIELLRASMEAVAYRLYAVWQQLRPLAPEAQLVASGSAILSSPAWGQILADVLGRPLHALSDREATSRGTALLALEALDLLPDAAAAGFKYRRSHEPRPTRHAHYQQAIARQQDLYRQLIER